MSKFLKQVMEKKKGKHLPEEYKHAKMSMLGSLHDEMQKMMGNDLKDNMHGMKSVKVASDSPEGLEHGLDQAKGMLQQHMDSHQDEDSDEDGMYEGGLSDEHVGSESQEHSGDEHEEGDDMEEHGEDEDHEDMEDEDEAGAGLDSKHVPTASQLLNESVEHESAEGDLSPEDIDDLIAHLQDKKAKMHMKG